MLRRTARRMPSHAFETSRNHRRRHDGISSSDHRWTFAIASRIADRYRNIKNRIGALIAVVECMTELDLHALRFVVRNDGELNDVARTRFLRFVAARGLSPTTEQLADALDNATTHYRSTDSLHARGTSPDIDIFGFDTSDCSMPQITTDTGGTSTKSGGIERRALLEFARASASEHTFLITESSAAEGTRFEFNNGHAEPAGRLRALDFLLGRFHGEGRYAHGTCMFTKDVVGACEADGRFVTLRIEVRYPTGNGGADVRHALVVVGTSEQSDQLIATEFTDRGETHDYVVAETEAGLQFDDRSPDYPTPWKRVRAFLCPMQDGY